MLYINNHQYQLVSNILLYRVYRKLLRGVWRNERVSSQIEPNDLQ